MCIVRRYQNKILAGGILILAVTLRFSKMIWERDFWYDEAFTGIITRMSWEKMWWMIFHDVHPPLYYYLLKPWASLFDYSVFGFRSFSAVLGVLGVVSIYWVGKKLFNEKVGLLASFFMAISPFAILYSQEARMYSLLGFLIIWWAYFLIKSLKSDKLSDWLWWALFSILCLYTHYLAIFFLVMAGVTFIGYKLVFSRNKKDSLVTKVKNIVTAWKFMGAVLIIGVAFSLWLPAFQQHTSRKGLGWIPVAYIGDIPESLQVFFLGHSPSTMAIAEANKFRELPFAFDGEVPGTLLGNSTVGLVILIILMVGHINLWRKNKWRKEVFVITGLSFGVLIFLILLSQIGKRFYVDRYFTPVAMLIYLLLAMVIGQLRIKWQWIAVVSYVGILLWLRPIVFDSSWGNILSDSTMINEKTTVITDNAFEYTTARFHFGEGRVKLYNQGDPEQDLSMWIVVKPEDHITRLDKYLQKENVVYVGSWGYSWKGFDLQTLKDVGRLKIYK